MKTTIFIVLKVAALTAILFICFAVAASAVGLQGNAPAPENSGAPAAGLLLADCFLCTLVLTYLVLRSRWAGWRLVATVFFVFYGVMTFMSQIETAVFVTRLPAGMLPRLFLMGALIAAPFSALAVLVLGKRKAEADDDQELNPRLLMPAPQWAWRLAALALAYLIVYFTFGYFIAWRNPAVPAYYGGVDEGSFLARMSVVLTDTFWLIPFQILRALLWVAIALPVVRMTKGRWPETALMVGLLFAVLMSAQLLLPNPYMPEAVRMAHLRETASSNFIFGCLVGWLLTLRHEPAKLS
ncbi:MAG: hypothetical protein PHS32_13300 [Rhodoferax sp.]|uniref:hypothetical protein n=1 Tax=Rhodoferax sp. TaxID=50421 RepID=UPI0026306D63|nr:hypothetical protein [Rhodoferax sp.]MDD5334706.1 hypothetical protein [Rhodoferax sp.]